MDYSTLIDAETWAFITQTQEYYPPDAVDMPIAAHRQIYDRMCRAFFRDYPQGVITEDRVADGVPIRIYEKSSAPVTVIYFHGGGFILGGLESHDDVCAEICDRTGYRVVSVDYRLAPEHKHPAQFEDAWIASQYVTLTWPNPIILAGDSAGGNLAAAVAHHARGRMDNIIGQVLVYSGLGGDLDKGSYLSHANAPMLTRDQTSFYTGIRLTGAPPVNDPTYAPLQDSDFADLPPSVIISAQCDPMSDDGRDYRDRIIAAGGKAHWRNETGLVHGYLRARSTVSRARSSFTFVVTAIQALEDREWLW